MVELEEGIGFEQYLNSSKEEYKQEQLQIYKQVNLADNTKEIISKISKKINIIIFAEIYCPDCRILLPYLEKMRELNDNISIYIFPRKGYEAVMEEYIEVARIPTILRFDSSKQLLGQFVEFPQDFKTMLKGLNEEEKKALIENYRCGEYNRLIEQEILEEIILR
ncbi:thioredoxin-like protein [Orenia metallireducens]|uniref:Thioredoxin n=1 Tax=Orenia metallireducens TaxID=1413210 RepID=A0A285I8D6_9FIRM|nr:thioredoxin family protein [Orenia metallireducens]PRX21666.1 thioredoxin-like protein [Orenia metallireducens]SNY44240.1 Thioredoxin [Orenia metallireducens]